MRERAGKSRRVVVKLGSNVLAGPQDGLDVAVVAGLAREIHAARAAGREIVVVTSGAVLAGRRKLGIAPASPLDLDVAVKQAIAAVGQVEIMRFWQSIFDWYGIAVGQILVTRDIVSVRSRFIAARHTLRQLLDLDVIPIVNENDSVASEEIQLGDNDNLSAIVAGAVDADLLVLLTDCDGLYSKDPRTNHDARLIDFVALDDDGRDFRAGDSASGVGLGGMGTKVASARLAARTGAVTVIANGKTQGTLTRVLAGESVGTIFEPSETPLRARKRWLLFQDQPEGVLVVDAGAVAALCERGKSLLPGGVAEVIGDFDRGGVVEIRDAGGRAIARGLATYSADEIRAIRGRRTDAIADALGFKLKDEVVHRDDMTLLEMP
ncbi:MAG: glutamate 5-kinase [Deltaproteobacteria bacterium]|nr:glutamate 5-kinase [Deltaproteobacteria bacterium]